MLTIRKLLKGILMLGSFFSFKSIDAQNTQTDKLLPNIMSPEAASLGKYGSYNVNYYTGAPNISIPLHAINESGVQIPITLSYDASGFIPNKNASMVGLNWDLSAGGAITRTVNGRADDSYDPNPVINPDPLGYDKGYIYGQLQANLPHYTSEEVRTINFLVQPDQSGHNMNDPGYSPKFNLQYEYAPDIFSFNFLGHSGKFFLDNNGQVQVSSDRRYKVDLTDLKPQYDFSQSMGILNNSLTATTLNTSLFSQIKMISDDGFEFTFGGAFKDIEVQFSYANSTNREVDSKTGVINAWYLTKVKTPEGTEILFNNYVYTDNDATVIKNLFSAPGNWESIPASFLEVKIFRSQVRTFTFNSGGTTSSNSGDQYSKSLIKHCYLDKVITDLQTVKFNYLPKDQTDRFYNGNIFYNGVNVNKNANYFTQKLDNIQVWDNLNGGGIPDGYQPFPNTKTIYFSYLNKSAINSTGNRLFLDNVNINGSHYTFLYTNNTSLPDPITKGIDMWGFYNGKDDNTQMVGDPQQDYGPAGEYEVDLQSLGNDRRAYANVALNGILSSITYPTGGTTQFLFENNDYSKILKRKVSSGITPVWENASGIAGGLRIQKIINTPGTTTTFKYILNYDQNPNGPSSGLLTKDDVYKKDFIANPGITDIIVNDNNITGAATYAEPYIGYKEVVEINSEGFTKHEFTNHETNPDTYFLGNDSYKLTTERSITNYNNQLLRLFKYSSREDERGKLSKQTIYTSANVPVKSVEYIYNNDPQRDLTRTIGVYSPYSLRTSANLANPMWLVALLHSYALYYYHNLPTSIIEKDYSSNSVNPLVTTTTLTYKSNSNPLLLQKTVTQSGGSVLKYEYLYPEDFPSQQPYTAMISKNIIAPVVRETISKNNIVLTVNKHNYGEFYVTNGVTNATFYRVASEKTVNQQLLPNVDQDILSVTGYNIKGMLTEANKPDGQTVPQSFSYLWDYKGLFPVAKVSNSTNFEVAYTSFEADGNGGWNFNPGAVINNSTSPMGKKCYTLTGNSLGVINDIPNATHIVSYWSNNGAYSVSGTQPVKQGATVNGWTYFEHEISSGPFSINITGSGQIDEVRYYPKGAVMTTYSYEPLVGITSQCDPNNKIAYYEYDNRERLRMIRDQDRKIIKKICYNTWDQADNCALDAGADWRLTGVTRCKPCPANNNYISNILQQEQKDVNPQSATYNQSNWLDVGVSGTCVPPADWQNTATAVRCKLNAGNQNTGEQEQEQKDMNPCSATYNQTRWIVIGTNTTACPLPPPCDSTNCVGVDKKCINGICETAVKQYTAAVFSHGHWNCTYQWVWSDCSISINYQETLNSAPSLAIVCF